MIGKILCWFGFHDYGPYWATFQPEPCSRCGRKSHHYVKGGRMVRSPWLGKVPENMEAEES